MKRFYKYDTLAEYEAAKSSLPNNHVALVAGTVYINGHAGSGGGGGMTPDDYYTKQETDALIPDVSNFVTMAQVEAKGYALNSNVYSRTDIDLKVGELEGDVEEASTAAANAEASATAAEATAAAAEKLYSDILGAMQSLPDGSAVSAQVAINTADIAELVGGAPVSLDVTEYFTSNKNKTADSSLNVIHSAAEVLYANEYDVSKLAGAKISFYAYGYIGFRMADGTTTDVHDVKKYTERLELVVPNGATHFVLSGASSLNTKQSIIIEKACDSGRIGDIEDDVKTLGEEFDEIKETTDKVADVVEYFNGSEGIDIDITGSIVWQQCVVNSNLQLVSSYNANAKAQDIDVSRYAGATITFRAYGYIGFRMADGSIYDVHNVGTELPWKYTEWLSIVVPEGATHFVLGFYSNLISLSVQKVTLKKEAEESLPSKVEKLQEVDVYTRAHKWEGKNVLVIGDSISDKLYHHASVAEWEKWPQILQKQNGFDLEADAISATGFLASNSNTNTSLINRLSAHDGQEYDMIVIFLGINDFIQNKPIGTTPTDNKSADFVSAVDWCIKHIIKNHTSSRLLGILPLPVGSNRQQLSDTYVNVLRERYDYYCIPYLDLRKAGGFRPWMNEFNSIFCEKGGDGNPDRTHPNQKWDNGFLAPMIGEFINRYL